MCRCTFKLHYWPACTTVWFGITFLTSYLVGVFNDHVYYVFPFISDTGTHPPESCIFGQMLNIGALLMGIVMYVRHRQIKMALKSGEIELSRKWNTVSTWCGAIACLGMSVVANFQETNVAIMHFFGAIMAFLIGSVYFILQTRISFAFRPLYYKNIKTGVSRRLLYARLFMGISFLPLFFANSICSSIAYSQFDGDSVTWWTAENAGYTMRLAATITEWILAIFMILYILSYTKEFKSLEFEKISFKSKSDDSQPSTNVHSISS